MKNADRLIFILGVLVFLSSCSGSAGRRRNGSGQSKSVGIQLYSVREDMEKDPSATLARLGEIGYAYAEAAGYADGKFYGMSPVEFKTLLGKNGMSMKGSHAGINLPAAVDWGKTMAWWDTCIAAHKEAGAEWIVKPSMGREAYRSLDTLKMYCAYYNAIGEKCNAAGIRFGYHNHASEFDTELDGKPVYDILLENTDPEKVMFQLDLYWIKEGGKEASDYFERYPGRFEIYHVKDEKELGASGTMDFKTAFELAEKAGMKHYVVEVERYDYAPLESVTRSYEFLNTADYVK
ncbi:MAG: sugar phosphate isomerase/epimerase family protein [Mangrovibacterium sp.]